MAPKDKGMDFTKGSTQYTFNNEQLESQRNLINDINVGIDAMNAGSTEYNKSLIKQNENFSAILAEKRKIAGTKDLGGEDFQDLVKAVEDLREGNNDINAIIKKRAKAQAAGKNDVADLYGIELKRQQTQGVINSALGAADDITGGLVTKAQDAQKQFKAMGGGIKGGIVVGLLAAVAILNQFNKQQEAIADQFGAIGVTQFRDDLAASNQAFVKLGFSAEESNQTISNLSNNFGVAFSQADELANVVADTAKATGQSLDNMTNFIGALTTAGGLTSQQASDLAKSAQSLAVANDVAPDQILADVANNTEAFAKFAVDGGKNILRAAVQARKLGLSLDKVASVSEGLLDFQSSLNAEVEASVLIGRKLNFQKARELALANDIEGATAAVVEQLGSAEEFNKLNAIQRKALADAAGLEVSELSKIVNKEKEALTLSGQLNKQKIEDIVSEKAITATAQLIQDLKVLGMQLAENIGPAVNLVVKAVGLLTKGLNAIGGIMPVIIAGLSIMTVKLLNAAVAKGMLTKEYYKNIAAQTKEFFITSKNNILLVASTIATGANTVATGANTIVKNANLATVYAATAAGAAFLISLIGSTTAYIANTAATVANTAVKGAAIIASYALAAGKLILAAATYFAGAAAGSASTLGFGAPILTALAVGSIIAMIASFMKAKSASKAGDMMSPATGKTQISTKEGGLFEMSKNDDILAGPGLAKAGGGVVNTTDTGKLEEQQNQSNLKLERMAAVLEGALAGPKPALARAMGSQVGDTVGGMA